RKMSAEPNHATRRKPNAADWRPPLPDARRLLPSVQSLVGFHGAHFVAPHFDALANLVANFARTCEALFTRAGERQDLENSSALASLLRERWGSARRWYRRKR